MNVLIEYGDPGPAFWDEYRDLWMNSLRRSPFQAPHYLRFLAVTAGNDIAVFRCYQGEQLLGAAFFRKNAGRYQFLSDYKTDHNYFTILKSCTPADWEGFFRQFVWAVRREKWDLFLDKQPSWAPYREALDRAVEESGMYAETSRYSVCLSLEEQDPEILMRYFERQKLPQKLNRLKRMGDFQFECFEGTEDLDQWIADYCQSHIARWEQTKTPSAFTDPERIAFLKQCMLEWIKEGLLVRFAINLSGNRISFAIGLKEEEALIHHSTTYDMVFSKYSPGLVIIRLMAEWMITNGFGRLDYGDGDEGYKTLFCNREGEINRIYMSANRSLPFIMKAKFTKALRESPRLHRFYLEQIKPLAQKVRL